MNQETREKVFDRDMYECQRCGLPATEIAHRVAKTQSNAQEIQRKYYPGRTIPWIRQNILDHPFNLASSCRLCNDYYNIGNNPREKEKVIKIIIDNYNNV